MHKMGKTTQITVEETPVEIPCTDNIALVLGLSPMEVDALARLLYPVAATGDSSVLSRIFNGVAECAPELLPAHIRAWYNS